MELTEFTLKLIIILAPGIMASLIFEKLTIKKPWTPFRFTIISVLYGGIIYILLEFIHSNLFNIDPALTDFWSNLLIKDSEIPINVVMIGLILSFLISPLTVAFEHYKVLTKIAQLLFLTTKFGDENLFMFFLSSREVHECYIRDLEKDIIYHGVIRSYSETDDIKEIVLEQVSLYQAGSKFQELDKLYICRSKDDISIEIPYIETENNSTVRKYFKLFKFKILIQWQKKRNRKLDHLPKD